MQIKQKEVTMKALILIISLITLSSCNTITKEVTVSTGPTEPKLHYKKYTFQAIAVTSPNTNYNKCFNSAEEIVLRKDIEINEFPIVQISPGETRYEDNCTPLLTANSINEGENGPIIIKDALEITELGKRTIVTMVGEPKNGLVRMKFKFSDRIFLRLEMHKYNGEISTGMPIIKEIGCESSGVFVLNKWYRMSGQINDNETMDLLLRVLPPDAKNIKSIVADQIIRK